MSLHIGSARTALYNFLFARHHGGSFVVRIEDTDAARSEARYESAILDDLALAGPAWDEGPDRGGPVTAPTARASAAGLYRAAAARARERGSPTAASARGAARARCAPSAGAPDACRATIAAAAACRPGRSRAGSAPVSRPPLRFASPRARSSSTTSSAAASPSPRDVIGDFIILRSDGVAGYNFAAAVDDAEMAISHVIRGDDHVTNTARQVLLLAALGAGRRGTRTTR